ncbi:MAG: hypothetical protein PSV23_01605 [Brevundimonas sp.]|uniref:hypothetical protein n=1 Tax=Brevundimonas sp. TaxID=1871086 RepID=UPI00248928FA|nr:hypothetical protein [Brevundimonas sp.]MDI1325471.1 hypothetical protein [Brevundimonas sp.]
MIALFAAATIFAAAPCSPPSGHEALWTPEARFVIVGEIHGAAETPAAFAQLVCAAAEQGPVTVALELPVEMQPRLDAFLAAPDDTTAAEALRDTIFHNATMADGRTSLAMLEMMQSIRRLKAGGADVAFRAFQPSSPRPAAFDQNYYELDMAVELSRAATERPESRVLVLVGNIHASKTRFDRFDLMPAAAHLPPRETITLNVAQQGGQSWSCQADGCRAHDSMTRYDAEARGVVMGPVSDGAYDGVIAIGPWTASPPVAAQASAAP